MLGVSSRYELRGFKRKVDECHFADIVEVCLSVKVGRT